MATHGTVVSRFTPKTPQTCTEQSYFWLSLFLVLLPFVPHWTQSPAHPYSPTMSLTPSIPLGSIAPNIFITCGRMPPAVCLCSKPQVPKSPLPSLPGSFVPSGDII